MVRRFCISIATGGFAERFLVGEDPLVGDGALLGSAGALAFGAAHFFDGLGFGGGLAVADGFELIAEFAAGEETVHLAGAVHLAFDGDAGGEVFQENAVRRFVDLLAAGAGTAHEFLEQVFLGDSEFGHLLLEGALFIG